MGRLLAGTGTRGWWGRARLCAAPVNTCNSGSRFRRKCKKENSKGRWGARSRASGGTHRAKRFSLIEFPLMWVAGSLLKHPVPQSSHSPGISLLRPVCSTHLGSVLHTSDKSYQQRSDVRSRTHVHFYTHSCWARKNQDAFRNQGKSNPSPASKMR